MSYTIYSYPNGYKVRKAQIAALYAGIDLKLQTVEMGKDNKTPQFLAKNPLGKVPVLDTPCGPVFESNAILRHIGRLSSSLYGGSVREAALVDQWIEYSANELEPPRAIWLYAINGWIPYNAKQHGEAKKDVEKSLKLLNEHLLNNTFIVGNHVTIADIAIFTALVDPVEKLFAPSFIKPFENLLRWFNTIANQPNVHKIVGAVKFATEEAQAPKPAKPAADKPAKAEKPKEAAKAKPEAKSVADEVEEELSAAPKKKPNPLDLLPETPMLLDPIKKLAFSQRPILSDFFEQLWPQFDANGYSWWTCHYKYNDENKVFYMTGNAVGGFLQRSDACRKYAMGVMNITGNEDEETPPFNVQGAWLFRGPEIIKEMTEENPDSEYYDWKKIDISTPQGKQTIKEQFMADKLGGLSVLDRRFFK